MPLGILSTGWATLLAVAFALVLAARPAKAEPGGSRTASSAPAHWAFAPPTPATPPPVRRSAWVKNPVDQFILARLEASRLRPARTASREELIRRVTFDLLGLPPTPDEIDAFVRDRSPKAWEHLVDRLLASPHYGERWARHWLDVVRYAESDGFEHDAVRPNSWRYRDYVVRSLNADKPYDRFVQEQVAGDELWPGTPDAVIATAFHLLGPDMVDSADQTQRRLLTLSDMTDTTAAAFLGLTLGCARCHDHKREPFTQADYYAFQAHFAAAQFQRDQPVPTEAERHRHELAMADYQAKAGRLRAELAALESPARDRVREEKLAKLSEDVQLAHRTPRERRTPEQESSVLETTPGLQVTDVELAGALNAADRLRRTNLLAALKTIPTPAPLPTTLALQNTNGPAAATHILARGDYNSPAELVIPATPVVLRRDPAGIPSVSGTPGRTPLARWLTAAENPLTARVMVNRVWQHHFGRGIVATPNDFGTQGSRPSHPELLDWLAQEFMTRSWSLKSLHRLILLSNTYQQSSKAEANTRRIDPDNLWFSRQNRLRLEGEALRDALLQISGRLDPQVGGPSVQSSPDQRQRRSLYLFARRNLRFPFLEVFDAPDSNLSCAERGQSTTAPQSLTLLNSSEVTSAAHETARHLTTALGTTTTRVEQAFRLTLGRHPRAVELRAALRFLEETRRRTPTTVTATDPAASGSVPFEWIELCRALFNLNDFVYVN